jgi:predicted 3-demethylubiquinone-9 3-methyltransferase (glyoxalase superfamily)
MAQIEGITPCLWFDSQGEDAARFYTGIFPNSRIVAIARYPKAGQEIHGRPEGSVMTVEFELAGQPFTALNGGPHFTFSEAISFQVRCATQAEIDYRRRPRQRNFVVLRGPSWLNSPYAPFTADISCSPAPERH